MEIPIEILIKYQMAFDGETVEESRAHYDNDRHFYETFLIQTDHIPNKIIESLIETMNEATALNFIVKFIEWVLETYKNYHEIISYRTYARTKLQ